MAAIVRIFETDEAAKSAAAKLVDAGYEDYLPLLAETVGGKEEQSVRSVVDAGLLPPSQAAHCIDELKAGRSLVCVRPRFGHALRATSIMEENGAVEPDALPTAVDRDPTPFSDFLGIPALSEFNAMTGLAKSWSLSGALGLGMLSRRAAPLSSMFGMRTTSTPPTKKNSSFGMPLLKNNPAPLSSMFGMPVLRSRKKNWETSHGFYLLSRNPAPLSSLFGMATLKKN